MIDEFSNALFKYSIKSLNKSNNTDSIMLEESRLKPIEERWRQSSCKRGHGHYTKNPDEPLFTDLVSSLLTCKNDVNCDLKLPTLSPDWLNTVVGLILSTRNNIRHLDNLSSSLFYNSKLINVISTFVDKWTSGTASDGDLANITSTLSTQELPESSERSAYILEQILIPLLPCHLLVNKIYSCKYCDSKVKMQMTITSIPVNTTKTGLNLEHLIYSFFLPTQSDFLCSLCNKPTIRNIEVVQWPPVLIININDIQTHAKFLKPTYVISLNHFSNWLAIGSPSAFIYDLICFNSLIQSGTSTTMHLNDTGVITKQIFSSSYIDGILSDSCDIGSIPSLEGSNPITNHPAMLHVIENPYLYDIFTSIFHGIHPVTFDYKWLRTMYHGGNTGCHMDRVYMNRGSSELLTCWIPLDNIALDMSVLAILEGSHRMDRSENDIYTKLQHTYADMDVERDKLQGTGWFTEDPMEFYHLNEACQSCDSHPVWKTTGDF
ncbi:unnamed protein product [Rotaria sp. Silwood2]|nr:unnamed protein product [Rotaria sp. Silwood2]